MLHSPTRCHVRKYWIPVSTTQGNRSTVETSKHCVLVDFLEGVSIMQLWHTITSDRPLGTSFLGNASHNYRVSDMHCRRKGKCHDAGVVHAMEPSRNICAEIGTETSMSVVAVPEVMDPQRSRRWDEYRVANQHSRKLGYLAGGDLLGCKGV